MYSLEPSRPPTPPGHGLLAPQALHDLPRHRREALLWWYAHELDYDGVEELVLRRAQWPCRWDWFGGDLSQTRAALGVDGRYHLRVDGRTLCTHKSPRRGQLPEPVGLQLVEDAPVPSDLIPPGRRCLEGHTPGCMWPGYSDPGGTPMQRLRARLGAVLGRACGGCRRAPAFAIDHDHRTGLVRGALCRNCNTDIEQCPHLAGCPWATYLDNPPAARLNLTFPRAAAALRARRCTVTHQRRVELSSDPEP